MKVFSKKFYIFLTDAFCFFLSLFLVLILRYFYDFLAYFPVHFFSFGIFFLILVLIIYSFDLYEPIYFRFDKEFLTSAVSALILAFFLGLGYFYFGKPLGLPISPYTNFIIFYIIFSILFFFFRQIVFQKIKIQRLIIFVGKPHPLLEEIKIFLKENYHLGLELKIFNSFEEISKIKKPDFLVVNLPSTEISLSNFNSLINFFTLENFYIYLFKKIPIKFLNKKEILNQISKPPFLSYFLLKRIFDFLISIPVIIFTALLTPFIALGIKISDPGPIFIKQKRVGQFGKEIIIYKFRTMYQIQETTDFWTKIDDPRIFPFGRFLRKIHFDELPQVLNILRGDLTLVGPRVECLNIVEYLKDRIPYFQLRHLAKPGITGWALLMTGYGSSIDDYIKKINYDLYYIANRSLIFDLLIIFRTLKEVFQMRGR